MVDFYLIYKSIKGLEENVYIAHLCIAWRRDRHYIEY